MSQTSVFKLDNKAQEMVKCRRQVWLLTIPLGKRQKMDLLRLLVQVRSHRNCHRTTSHAPDTNSLDEY